MNAAEWLDDMTEGLGMLFAAGDDRAIDAFLEVARLAGERAE